MRNYFASVICALGFVVPAGLSAETATNMSAVNNTNCFTIVAFGDSTTAPRGKLMVYAQILQNSLRSQSESIRVINAGIGGNTTAMGRVRFKKDVLAKSPDIVIIGFGINDSAIDVWKTPPVTKPRIAQSKYENNLRYFAQTLKTNKVQVILMTPNTLRWTPNLKKLYGKPPYNPDDPDGFNLLLRDYAESVREIAREENVQLVDVFAEFVKFGKQSGKSIDDLLLDGMHPNVHGHKIVADLLVKTIIAANPDIMFNLDAR